MSFFRHVWHRLPYIALYTLAFYVIFLVGQQLFYRFMPADYFLHYYKATPHSTEIGEDLHMTLCRTKHVNNIKLQATRTFLMQQSEPANDFVPVYTYTYQPTIEQGKPC